MQRGVCKESLPLTTLSTCSCPRKCVRCCLASASLARKHGSQGTTHEPLSNLTFRSCCGRTTVAEAANGLPMEAVERVEKTSRLKRAGLWRSLLMFLSIVGPGMITANIDNDAGGI